MSTSDVARVRGLLAIGASAVGAMLASACGTANGRDDVLSDSAYVEVMARLARVRSQFTPRDSVRGDSARRAVLAELDVEAGELSEYASRYGEDAAHMMEIWTTINLRVLTLDSLEQALEREAELRARDTLSADDERE
jgi:hypothetical protein